MTKNKRITLALDKAYIQKFNDICTILGTKQYSKAIKVLIDTYLYIEEQNVS